MPQSFARPFAVLSALVLATGAVPLDILERSMDDWNAAQKAK